MIDAVNSHARTTNGRRQYPTMYGADGWYGWQAAAVERGRAGSLVLVDEAGRSGARVGKDPGWRYLQGKNPGYPGDGACSGISTAIPTARWRDARATTTPADKRLADNMMDYNPAAADALIRLMLGGLPPGRDGGLLNARLRYFDPARKRAGVPEDVAALVSAMGDTAPS